MREGIEPDRIVELACEKVAGIDIHPVAAIFARATYLLALMPVLREGRPVSISIPVYLGDALQWNAREFMNLRDLEIIVPREGEATGVGEKLPDDDENGRVVLRFPINFASDPALFDATLDEMLSLAERNEDAPALDGWLARRGIGDRADCNMLLSTYDSLRLLQRQGRNHIWGYVARNLSRPIWLASEAQKADVVVGNPPWLDYRSMNPATQKRFKHEMTSSGLWGKGVHGAAFDLSAYFFCQAVNLYMRQNGRIGFVLPYAALTRKAYAEFLKGEFRLGGKTASTFNSPRLGHSLQTSDHYSQCHLVFSSRSAPLGKRNCRT